MNIGKKKKIVTYMKAMKQKMTSHKITNLNLSDANATRVIPRQRFKHACKPNEKSPLMHIYWAVFNLDTHIKYLRLFIG